MVFCLAALGLAWGGVSAGQEKTTLEDVFTAAHADKKVNLCGYYREGDNILHIKQKGDEVKGYFSQGKNECVANGGLYFWGTLSGLKFAGTVNACNPQECVRAGFLTEPIAETDFSFLVSSEEGHKQLVGSWEQNEYDYEEYDGRPHDCPPTGNKLLQDFIAQKEENDCASLQQELSNLKKEQAYYGGSGYQGLSSGPVVYDGREIFRDFNSFQDWMAQKHSQETHAGTTMYEGEIKYWDINDVIAGNARGHDGVCWCETQCTDSEATDCTEAWAEEGCEIHESSHCKHVVDFCNEQLAGKSATEAMAAYESFFSNTKLQMQDEYRAYQAQIDFMEQQLKDQGCI